MALRETSKFIGVVEDSMHRKSKAGNYYIRLVIKDELGSFNAMMVDNKNEKKCTKYIESGKKIPEKDDIVVLRGSKGDDVLFIEGVEVMTSKIYMKLSDLKG